MLIEVLRCEQGEGMTRKFGYEDDGAGESGWEQRFLFRVVSLFVLVV